MDSNRVRLVLSRLVRAVGNKRIFALIWRIRVGGLLLAALSIWGFAQIADEVLEKESQAFDTRILLAIERIHTPLLDRVMLGITFIGDPTVLLIICLGFGIWLLKQGRRATTTTLGVAAVGAIVLNFLLKNLFGRARPELWNRIVDVGYYSFPSGHAMVSLVIYGLLGYILSTQFPRARKFILCLTAILVAAIGFSRLYLGVHWPTDVAAGYAAGLVWLIACISSLKVWRKYRSARQRRLNGSK